MITSAAGPFSHARLLCAVSLSVPAVQHVLSKDVQYTDKSGEKDRNKGMQVLRHGHEADDG